MKFEIMIGSLLVGAFIAAIAVLSYNTNKIYELKSTVNQMSEQIEAMQAFIPDLFTFAEEN